MVPPARPGAVIPRRIASRYGRPPRRDIVEIAGSLGFHIVYVPSMRNGGAGRYGAAEDRGNAILSTLPLSKPTAIELPFEAQRRVAVAATLAGETSRREAWQLRLVNVHLDHRSRVSRAMASFGAARLRQARALLRALPLDSPIVLGGDLNTWSARRLEGAIRLLRAAFPATPGEVGPTYPIAPGLSRPLDHLFFRVPAHCRIGALRLDSRYGSDHYPVAGWIEF